MKISQLIKVLENFEKQKQLKGMNILDVKIEDYKYEGEDSVKVTVWGKAPVSKESSYPKPYGDFPMNVGFKKGSPVIEGHYDRIVLSDASFDAYHHQVFRKIMKENFEKDGPFDHEVIREYVKSLESGCADVEMFDESESYIDFLARIEKESNDKTGESHE